MLDEYSKLKTKILVVSDGFDSGDDVLIHQLCLLRRGKGDLCIHGHSVQVLGGEDCGCFLVEHVFGLDYGDYEIL